MKREEAILNIKETLKNLMKFSKQMKYQDIPLTDGTSLSIEDGSDIEVGTPVFQIDANGNSIPANDATYILADGRTIVVTGGLIASITDSTTTQGDSQAASPEADANVQSSKMSSDNEPSAPTGATNTKDANGLEERISNLEGQVSEILEVLQSMSNMQEQTMSSLLEFSKEPAEKSYKAVKTGSSDISKRNKFSADMEELKEIQKKFNLSSNNQNHRSFSTSAGSTK